MVHIDEWNVPEWVSLEWDGAPAQPVPPPGAAQQAARTRQLHLVHDICQRLGSSASPEPIGVHFYLGEGLRWIRVGFDEGRTLQPSAVRDVGQAIASCLARRESLYFHALRPHDLLFFLEGGDPRKLGRTAPSFGQPLQEVLQAWGLATSVARKKALPHPRRARKKMPQAGAR